VVCVCDPFTFPITPSGFGAINEIPAPGSFSNPSFGGLIPAPWGGTDFGCLYAAELNSSWMLITIGATGSLGFSFGAGGQQVGYYDWAMWPYTGPGTCNAIMNSTLAPARCLWNAVPYGGTGMANTLPMGADPGNYAPQLPVIAGQQYIICMSNWSYVNANVTLDFFGTATVQCGIPLPIELIEFTAHDEGWAVQLQWVTASELDNDHFEVQRSTDALTWTTIGALPGSGTTPVMHTYALYDTDPWTGTAYYRLKQVDLNGTFSVSPIEALVRSATTAPTIWPQPNNGTFEVTVDDQRPITILDATGRLVDFERTSTGEHRARITLRNAPPGLYLLRIEGEHAPASRILVQ